MSGHARRNRGRAAVVQQELVPHTVPPSTHFILQH